MKVVRFLVEGMYWLNLFIVPVMFFGVPGFIVHHNYGSSWSLIVFIVLALGGVALGVYWAEQVRRTVGCSFYVNRIFWSRDITEAAAKSAKNSDDKAGFNWFETIESIKTTLKQNGYDNEAQVILDAQLAGGTGGEVLMIVCSKLLGIRKRNKDAYALISKEAKTLILYANSIGLKSHAT